MKVVVCSIPKAGTYLVGQLLTSLGLHNSNLHLNITASSDFKGVALDTARRDPQRFVLDEPLDRVLRRIEDNSFAVGHLPPSTACLLREFELVFVYRNIRDVLVSFTRFTETTGRYRTAHDHWRQLPDGPAKLLGCLKLHGPWLQGLIASAVGWIDMLGVPRISFEQLMGDYGEDIQLHALRTLESVACRTTCSESDLRMIIDNVLKTDTITKSQGRTDRSLFWDAAVERAFVQCGYAALNARLGFDEPSISPPKGGQGLLLKAFDYASGIVRRFKG